jgi:hypothetical protein
MRRYGLTLAVFASGLALGYALFAAREARDAIGPPARIVDGSSEPVARASDPEVVRLREEIDALKRRLEVSEASSGSGRPAEVVQVATTGEARFVVLDREGRPLVGTLVTLHCVEPGRFALWKELATGTDGSARADGLPPGRWTASVRLPGVTRTYEFSIMGGQVAEVIVEQSRPGAATVQGHVFDSDGIPIEGVVVMLCTKGLYSDSYAARTAADGAYVFRDVPAGEATIEASGGALKPSVPRLRVDVSVPESGTLERDIGLARLRGVVTEAGSGRPIAGVDVFTVGAHALTDSSGAYRLPDLPPGSCRVEFRKPGFMPKVVDSAGASESGGAVLDIELEPAAAIVLTLFDSGDRPFVGMFGLLIFAKSGNGPNLAIPLRTDDNGCAAYREIAPGEYDLQFVAEGVGRAKAKVTVVPGENALRIRLE